MTKQILDVIKCNASAAWDQRDEYDDAGHSFDAHLTNVFDTLNEKEYGGFVAIPGFAGWVWDQYRSEFARESGLPIQECFSAESVLRTVRRKLRGTHE